MDTDVMGNLGDIINVAEEDDDVRSSAGSSSIKDEVDGIGSVDSSYFNKRLSDLEQPQGPPVDSKYTSGIYRRRGTLGVDSSEVQGQPQPSQTIDDGNRSHSRQKRQTTTTMRTNSAPVPQSTASPQANQSLLQEPRQENSDTGRTNNTLDNYNPSAIGPETVFPDKDGPTRQPLGPAWHPGSQGGGEPPGGSPGGGRGDNEPNSSDGGSVDPSSKVEGFHLDVPHGGVDVGGGGGKNWSNEKSGTSSTYMKQNEIERK